MFSFVKFHFISYYTADAPEKLYVLLHEHSASSCKNRAETFIREMQETSLKKMIAADRPYAQPFESSKEKNSCSVGTAPIFTRFTLTIFISNMSAYCFKYHTIHDRPYYAHNHTTSRPAPTRRSPSQPAVHSIRGSSDRYR